MFYITNTEKDTWEVRISGMRDIAAFALIIRWGDSWEVRESIPDYALDLRLKVRSAIWDWIESETKARGEAQRPVYLFEPVPLRPEPRQQQKEEMPVWML